MPSIEHLEGPDRDTIQTLQSYSSHQLIHESTSIDKKQSVCIFFKTIKKERKKENEIEIGTPHV
jgi:hypothetical protein